ncbi:U3 small nucleolar RNA-interacting protein 2, partial [Stegodyphus mimosarum]
MSFFIRKKTGGEKRKKGLKNQNVIKKSKTNNVESYGMQEIIPSDEEFSGEEAHSDSFSSEEETEQEKKLRLTKKYLEQIENEEREKHLDDTKDAIAQRLKDEALEEEGRLEKKRAHEYENSTSEVFHIFKGHKLSITCLAVSTSEKIFFSASKDCSIIKWSIEEKKRLKTIPGGKKGAETTHRGHTAHILAMALSSDDKFLVSGCQNKIMHVWNPDTMELLKTFHGHKGAITGLIFLRGTHQLISASGDRTLKLWNLDEMGYIET